MNDADRWHTDEAEMGSILENYFHNMFTTSNPRNMETVFDSVERRVSLLINTQLCMAFTGPEVYQALFQTHPSKSLGPDGMSCFFFQKFWHIVGEDVINVVLSILNSGHILQKINYTHIVLIPKITNPRAVADFAPSAYVMWFIR